MANNKDAKQPEDDDIAAERDLGDDAAWKIIQKNTFTRWTNEMLKPSKTTVNDVVKDFADGLRLINLLECLSGKKFGKYNKKPNFRTQKFENVTVALKFLEQDEGIKLVNIDSSDLVDGKLKLIMGLIWTLILHYSISMPTWEGEDAAAAKDQTPKQRLLAWIQSKIPEKNITNFTSDWNDGTAIAALVDALGPGLCPDWAKMDKKNAIPNATLGEDAAEKWFDIPQLIKPNEMCNPQVDELSMMTYLSRFPNAKLKAGAPVQAGAKKPAGAPASKAAGPAPATSQAVDAKKVWTTGRGLQSKGLRVAKETSFRVHTENAGDAEPKVLILGPGGVNEKFTFKKVKTWFEYTYKPTKIGLYVITINFGSGNIPKSPFKVEVGANKPSKLKVSGSGLERGVVGSAAIFTVEPNGEAPISFKIDGPSQAKIDVKKDAKTGSMEVTYWPTAPGEYAVHVLSANIDAPESPYMADVVEAGAAPPAAQPKQEAVAPAAPASASNASKVKVYGPAVEKPVKTKTATYFIIDSKEAGPGQPVITLVDAKNTVVTYKLIDNKDLTYRIDFTAVTIGIYTLTVTWSSQPVTGSPFKITVEAAALAPGASDASKVKVSGPAIEKPVFTLTTTYVIIDCKEAGTGEPLFSILNDKGGPVQFKLIDNKDRTYRAEFELTLVGSYQVNVFFVGKPVPKSPFKVIAESSSNASKVKVHGPAVEQPVIANHSTYVIIDCTEAGQGNLLFTLVNEKISPVPFKLVDNKDGTYRVDFEATTVGIHTINIFFGNRPVPKSPFKIDVKSSVPQFDLSKVIVKGLPETVPVHFETTFEITFAGAGSGPIKVNLTAPSGQKFPALVEQGAEVAKVKFTPTEPGAHVIEITFNDQAVPNSPFTVHAVASDASKVRVYGPAIEQPVVSYQLTYLIIDFKEAGPGEPAVTLVDDKGTTLPFNILDNKDRTYRVEFSVITVTTVTLTVTYARQPVPKSPFKLHVQSGVKVYGPAVEKPAEPHHTTYFIVDCKQAGPGQPQVHVLTEAKAELPARVTDNGDRTYRVEFETTVTSGSLEVSVTFDNKPVPGSPFKVQVQSAVDSSKVIIKDLPERIVVHHPISFHISTAGAGPGQVKVNLVSPSGKVTPSHVDPAPDGAVAKIVATEPGPHEVQVTFADHPVPKSPFKVTASVPEEVPSQTTVPTQQAAAPAPAPTDDTSSKVKAYGAGLLRGTAGVVNEFVVDTRAAGPGSLGLSIDGPSQARIECFDKGGGLYDVHYWPTQPGQYATHVLYNDRPISGSPFSTQISPSKIVDLSGIKTHGPGVEPTVLLESVTEFTIDAKSLGTKPDGKFKVEVTLPSGGLIDGQVIDNKDGSYTALYTPFEQGQNKVSVTYDGVNVPGSPFTVGAVPGSNPSKVKVYGPGLKGGRPNKPISFTILTRGAGQGGLGLSVIGPTEPKVGCVDNQDGTLTVEYLPSSEGDHEIEVTFANQPIPGSPFHVNIAEEGPTVDPSQVKCSGPGLNPKGVRRGTLAVFSVDTTQAGEAVLEITATYVKTGERATVEVTKREAGKYDVLLRPDTEGPCRLDVKYGGQDVAHSPFTTEILPLSDPSKVVVSGDGAKPTHPVPASIPVSFVVDTRQAGTGQIDASIQSPNGKQVKPDIQSAGDGTYVVSYTPEEVGQYRIVLRFAGQDLPSGPFLVNTAPSGDASKVKVPVEKIRERLVIGEESVITIHKEEAGVGNVTATVTTSSITTVTTVTESSTTTTSVDVVVTDNRDGTVTIRYRPTRAGVYNLNIKFGGVTVPHGRVTQTVTETIEVVEEVLIQAAPVIPSQSAPTPAAPSQSEPTPAAPSQSEPTPAAPSQSAPTPTSFQTPQEGVPSPYKPWDFTIKIGSDFSKTEVEITTPSGVRHRPRFVDNHNGSIKVFYQPVELGLHTLSVTYDKAPVPLSPFKFYVHVKRSGQVIAHGPGLSVGIAGQPSSFTVVTKDSGPGGLGLAIEGPSKAEIKCNDNKDGTATISYTPVTPGEYKIVIKFAGQLIEGSPFTARVSPAEFVQETTTTTTTTTTTAKQTSSSATQLSLTVTEAELPSLTATIRSPSGQEYPSGLNRQPSGQLGLSFTPRESGEHWVSIFRNGQPIPNSPFKISISATESTTGTAPADASKVKVKGRALLEGVANEFNQFTVDAKDAGFGGLGVAVDGPGKVEIKCEQNPADGTTKVLYKPTEPGKYNVSIKYADGHVPGSPYVVIIRGGEGNSQSSTTTTTTTTAQTSDSIIRQQRMIQTIATVGSTAHLNIRVSGIDIRDIDGTVKSPSGLIGRCEVIDLGEGRLSVKFLPSETGVHIVSLKHKGIHIPGSPLQFTIGQVIGGGPQKVRAIGTGLLSGEVNKPCLYTIVTREAGPGSLSIGMEGPSKPTIDFQDKQDGTSDVTYQVSAPGEYHISIKYDNVHVSGSPFKAFIAPAEGDSRKISIQNLQRVGIQTNSAVQFNVDFNGAQGHLDAKVVSPSGKHTDAVLQEVQPGKYSVNFVPIESGIHYVHIRLSGNHVPGSPYPILIGGAAAETVAATQSVTQVQHQEQQQVQHTETQQQQQTHHVVSSSSSETVHVVQTQRTETSHQQQQETHQVRVSSEAVQVVQATPLLSTVVQTRIEADASKVTASGSGLQLANANQEAQFTVNGSATGYNMLLVGIAGPLVPCEQINVVHVGNLRYTVRYRLTQPGNYTLIVKWGDHHICGSPFNIVAI